MEEICSIGQHRLDLRRSKSFKTKNALDKTKTDVGMTFLLGRSATQ
ncbi:hypothetical protein J558_0641 [Acinetobacter baumannii 1106579]|jgi:hypothetical protein|nr:hypothetical protein ACINNAV82_1040 [Acinetobacter baumannii Naval-82]EXE20353.1 hypothetical protein J558_0641 [Acinetobacter baumannii 1106579]KMV25153.1 hypothetical protein AB987_0529 [Acinetobacter baumannii]